MNTKGLAAILQILGELRVAIDAPKSRDRSIRIQSEQRIEELWTDLATLLEEQKREGVARYDKWLRRVEDDLDSGGSTKALVELGIKLTDRRSAVVKLDVRATIPPSPDPDLIAALAEMQIQHEEFDDRIARGEPIAYSTRY